MSSLYIISKSATIFFNVSTAITEREKPKRNLKSLENIYRSFFKSLFHMCHIFILLRTL